MAYNGHVSYLVCGVLLHLDPPLGALGADPARRAGRMVGRVPDGDGSALTYLI